MIKPILGVICAATFLTTTLNYAQPTSSSPDPKGGAETTRTIKEYTPDSVLILDTLAPNGPTQFKLSKSVVYVEFTSVPVNSQFSQTAHRLAAGSTADDISIARN